MKIILETAEEIAAFQRTYSGAAFMFIDAAGNPVAVQWEVDRPGRAKPRLADDAIAPLEIPCLYRDVRNYNTWNAILK